MARPAHSYRAARRNKAIRRFKQMWRMLERIEMQGRGGPIYVPPVVTPEEREAMQS